MSDVQFNEDRSDLNNFKSRSILGQETTPGMARWLMKIGIVKNEKAAGMVLVLVMLTAFGLSIYFFMNTASTGGSEASSVQLKSR